MTIFAHLLKDLFLWAIDFQNECRTTGILLSQHSF